MIDLSGLRKTGDNSYDFSAFTVGSDEEEEYITALSDLLDGEDSVDPSSDMVYLLGGEFRAYVDSIWSDMWMGVSVVKPINEDTNISLFVQCDQLVYGLLAAYLIFKNVDFKIDVDKPAE